MLAIPFFSRMARRFHALLASMKAQVEKLRDPESTIAILCTIWMLGALAVIGLDISSVILVFTLIAVLTIVVCAIRKRPEPSPRLEEVKPIWNASVIEEATKTLSDAYNRYTHNVALSRIALESSKKGRAESEVSVYIVASTLYIYFVSMYIRINPPHPEESLDLVAVFLTTYGIVVVLAMIAAYFAFLKTFGDFYARWVVRGFNSKLRLQLKYVHQYVLSKEKLPPDGETDRVLISAFAKDELDRMIRETTRLDEVVPVVGLQATFSRLVVVIGGISGLLSLIPFVAGYFGKLELRFWMYAVLAGFFVAYVIAVLVAAPITRSRRLLRWTGTDTTISELRERLDNLMTACLGEKPTSILSKYLHVWPPRDRTQ
jgi:hypothetical protein